MTNLDEQLALAMRQESPLVAKRLGQPVLDAAEALGDRRIQARALACLAENELLLCNYRDAVAKGTRAAQIFQMLGDLQQEASALATIARASSALGRNDTAVEAALLALELARGSDDLQALSMALSRLGHVLSYSRSFDAARAALVEAEDLARTCDSAIDQYCALVLRGLCEAMHVIVVRHETGRCPNLDLVCEVFSRTEAFKAEHDMAALAEPDQMPFLVFADLTGGLLHCLCGDHETARRALQSKRAWLNCTEEAPWMDAFEALVTCELAQAMQDWPLAEQQGRLMIKLADALGHEVSALIGHTLLSRAYELQGEPARALLELKAMAARERRIRNESLASRHEVVAWQLQMRRSEQSRRDLQASTVRLEKLTLEDPLTGIANRRCFETEARGALRTSSDTSPPVCVALLDVDSFKQVNDRHSHVIGDKVLQVVAALLTEHVRQGDLAARLAGDEFVVLFKATEVRSAEAICERLRNAVGAYAWQDLSCGLAVSVSIGVAQSQHGDSLESLLQRSDQSMYECKNASRPV
jgi:diguanylate cyclase (GGDEF)-like protein